MIVNSNNKIKLFIGAVALALGLSATSASWANSLTFQDVTFNLDVINSGATLRLQVVTGATGASGDWATANGFAAFEVKDIGTAAGLSLGGWSVLDNALSANGCVNGNTSGGCFTRIAGPIAFGPNANLIFDISKASGTFNLSNPHLKVIFTLNGTTSINSACSQNQIGDCVTGKVGDLLSRDIPTNNVPEPTSLLLLGAGLAGLGVWRRKQA